MFGTRTPTVPADICDSAAWAFPRSLRLAQKNMKHRTSRQIDARSMEIDLLYVHRGRRRKEVSGRFTGKGRGAKILSAEVN
ncbi:hypothetical protein J2Z31_001810 [Sinorhizobium kostiense]|uniref:Transposase n=1 Tax=Sinorhizobium kostiense TaxID=76747 RepID=A0ABS4QXE0_9HYPH|nr:hypothetical protein [Sinorhizobium kostiense]MBP2235318.1 hypothetical protein [Sinorhizobium kostiense]